MANYSILIRTSAQKEIKSIGTKKDRNRIIQKIQELAENPRPHGCQKLTSGSFYRIRVGKYRIVYEVRDDKLIIIVIKVGHRKDVYR